MTQINVDTIIFPEWIIPIEPENLVLQDHALVISDGKILDILPSNQSDKYTTKEKIVLAHHALLPGFINAHAHSPMTLFRGLANDLSLMTWLTNHIWPAEKKWLSEEFCYDGARLAILEMLKSGTTCFNENYFFLKSIGKAAEDCNIRVSLGACILDFPTSFASNLSEYLSKTQEVFEHYKNHSLISVHISPHAPYSISDESFKQIKKFMQDNHHDCILQIHCHETQDEIQESLKQYQMRPLERLERLGILSSQTQAIHCVHLSNSDIDIIQKNHVHVVHCPESNLKLASGFSPIQTLFDRQINVALGTDGAASNNDMDMLGEMKTAAILAKAVSNNSSALNAFQALKMATLNGAKAMGIEKITGSLQINKQADMMAIDLSHPNTQPVYHPISQIVYAAQCAQINHVWIAGKHLLKNRELTQCDQTEILHKANIWKKKILDEL